MGAIAGGDYTPIIAIHCPEYYPDIPSWFSLQSSCELVILQVKMSCFVYYFKTLHPATPTSLSQYTKKF